MQSTDGIQDSKKSYIGDTINHNFCTHDWTTIVDFDLGPFMEI